MSYRPIDGARYYTRHKAECLARHKLWVQRNPEKYAAYYREWNWKQQKIDMTNERYDALFTKQKGKCAVCRTHQSRVKGRLTVDHNHTTGKTRGLLCRRCNRFVVMIVEKYGHLIAPAQRYLRKEVHDDSGTTSREKLS